MRKATRIMLGGAAILAVAVAAGYAVGVFTRHEKVNEALARIEWRAEPAAVPEFSFTDDAGVSHTLADFRGKALIVNFWATWCAPCVKELPALDALARAKRGQGFDVLAISVDLNGITAVRRFLTDNEIENLPAYVDARARATDTIGAVGLPVTIIVDARGREIGRASGPVEWNTSEAYALADKLSGAALAGK